MSHDYMKSLLRKTAGPDLEMSTYEDLLDLAEKRAHVSRWGKWKLRRYELVYRDPSTGDYEVSLADCLTGAEAADWIFQINGKAWATPKVVKDFISALEEIFDPQATLCTSGFNVDMPVEEMKRLVDERLSIPEEEQ
jgi:hypothetical protein